MSQLVALDAGEELNALCKLSAPWGIGGPTWNRADGRLVAACGTRCRLLRLSMGSREGHHRNRREASPTARLARSISLKKTGYGTDRHSWIASCTGQQRYLSPHRIIQERGGRTQTGLCGAVAEETASYVPGTAYIVCLVNGPEPHWKAP